MKTMNLLTGIFFMLCLVLSACSKDDDKDSGTDQDNVEATDSSADSSTSTSALLGTWSYEEDDYKATMTFTSAGVITGTVSEYYGGQWNEDSITGTYVYQNGKITCVYASGEIETVTVVSITSSTLTLKTEEDGVRKYTKQ